MKGIELRQLRYFSIVAKALHFRKAADLAFVTQPALSQQISKLEETVGVPLFVRDKRNVELTAAGLVLRDEVDKLFSQFDRALRLAREAGAECEFCLNIGMIEYTNLAFIAPALVRLQALYPEIRITRQEINSQGQPEALLERRIDVGFSAPPPNAVHAGVHAQALLRSRWGVVMPHHHRLAGHAQLQLADLASERIVMFERAIHPRLYDMVVADCLRAGFTPNFVYTTTQVQSGLSLASEGLGIMIGASYIFTTLPPELLFRPIGDMAELVIYAFTREAEDNPLLLDFIELVTQEARRIQIELDLCCHVEAEDDFMLPAHTATRSAYAINSPIGTGLPNK